MLNYYDAAGGVLTATANPTVVKAKAGDEQRTSDVAFSDDAGLKGWGVVANAVYVIDGLLWPESASATPDIKIQFTGPAGASFRAFGDLGRTLAVTVNNEIWTALSQSQAIPLAGVVDREGVIIKGWLSVGATTGTFSMQWAQNASHATPTALLAGSWLRLQKV